MSGGRRAVLFDAAGTLIHLREPIGKTYALFARRHGVEVPPRQIQEAFGAAFAGMPAMVFTSSAPQEIATRERDWWRALVRDVFRRTAAEERFSDFESFFAELFEHFARPTPWRAAPRAAEALATLRDSGLATGVVSNFDRRLLPILDGLGLAPLLDVVVLPSDAGAAKPSPRIFRLALDLLGVTPERALYVGDDAEHDVEGASWAGLASIDVRTLHALSDIPARLDSLLPPAS